MSTGKLPLPADGLQLNFCKTLACRNFGLEDEQYYILQHSNPSRPAMICRECGAFPPLLSNIEVKHEAQRQASLDRLPGCTNEQCQHYSTPAVLYPELYQHFGYSGLRQRLRCKHCRTTFTDPFSAPNSHLDIHAKIIEQLVQSKPVRDICRELSLNPKSFYHHLQLIAQRCQHVSAIFQHAILRHKPLQHLSVTINELQPKSHNGVDWLTIADEESGYILSQSTNYENLIAPPECGQHNPFDSNCQYLPLDSVNHGEANPSIWPEQLLSRIEGRYRQIMSRHNVEEPLHQSDFYRYPNNGSLIRSQYMVYGHFLHLKPFLNIDNTALYLPQEPLLRSAIVSIFKQEVANGSLSPVYVESIGEMDQPSDKVDIVLVGWWRDRWAINRNAKGSKGICHLGKQVGREKHWLAQARLDKNKRYVDNYRHYFHAYLDEPRRYSHPMMLQHLLSIYQSLHNLTAVFNQPAAQKANILSTPLSINALLSKGNPHQSGQ
ncbi:transposase [Thaumasiovibrio sp. DFM-14]|uniref:transposase n=1 Tax=Thaumasiovibrio sp. DFM-14 TaxID=3384792 RepID=UPI0039A33EB3